MSSLRVIVREGIKARHLRQSGKLKSTHPASCGSRNPRDGSWIAAIYFFVFAAAIHEPQSTRWNAVQLVDCGSYKFEGSCRNPRATIHEVAHGLWLVHCSRAAMHDLRLPQLPGWVEFSLPQRRNISSFIPSPNNRRIKI